VAFGPTRASPGGSESSSAVAAGIVATHVITIRREQLEALAEPFAIQFVERAVEHLRTHFPDQQAALGDEATREAVVFGIRRAEHHGFSSDGEVFAYLALMFVFGRDFDREIAWAREALGRLGSSAERMAQLENEALLHELEGTGYRKDAHG